MAVSIFAAGGGNCLQEELSVTLQTNATHRASRGHVPRIPDNRLETLPFQGDTEWGALLFRQVGWKQEAPSSAQQHGCIEFPSSSNFWKISRRFINVVTTFMETAANPVNSHCPFQQPLEMPAVPGCPEYS